MKLLTFPIAGTTKWVFALAFITIAGFGAVLPRVQAQSPLGGFSVNVTLSPDVSETPVTGRVLVFFSKRGNPPPRKGPNWFAAEPFFGVEVEQLKPGSSISIDDSADGFPNVLSKLPAGRYFVQAVLDRDFYFADHNHGPGNLYSTVREVVINPTQRGPVNLTLSLTVPQTRYRETEFAKVFHQDSELLSLAHGRPVQERALVLLPASYAADPSRRYPVYYEVTGFGATITELLTRHSSSSVAADGVEFIHVLLTGQCKWGHHVYADSATNGPRGSALVKEMIPAIDARFRTIANASARFVGGHSSGGWASLWLQIQHPTTFGGCWSTAPDPVDFRDWQGTNLYEQGANVCRDQNGFKKPLARSGGRPILWYEDFLKMDDALGRGGQLRSFEAVFSPLGADGLPVKCWDRQTGAVVPQVVDDWRKYDISLFLQSNWPQLKDVLAGKIHVFMGTQDTFYLDGATRLLADRLRALGSAGEIEFFEGRNHFNLIDRQLRRRIYAAMAAAFRKSRRNASPR